MMPRACAVLVVGLVLGCATPQAAAPPAAPTSATAPAPRLTPERLFADPALAGPSPRALKFSPDGSLLAFLRPREDDQLIQDLWAYDAATGKARPLVEASALEPKGAALSEEEKARRERMRIREGGIVDFEWDERGQALIIPAAGDVFYAKLTGGAPDVARLTTTEAFETDPKASPAGGYVSFVRGGALYAVELANRKELRISPAASAGVSYGVAEFVAQEEMYRFTGAWWSPDDRRIAYTRVDERGVDIVKRFDIGADGVAVVEQRYPKTGRPNAVVDLFVRDLKTGKTVQVDLGPDDDIYLARVDWLNPETLIVQRQNRAQTQLDVLAVNPADGKAKTLFSETAKTWVNLHNDFTPLKDGRRFLWSSERTGYRHVFLYAADGALIRQVTSGDWPLAEASRGKGAIAGVDEAKGLVFVTGFADGGLEQHLYATSYEKDAAPLARITAPGGWWSASMAKSGTAYAATYSDPETPPRVSLHRADGTQVAWIEENRLGPDHPYGPYRARHVTPSFGTLAAKDGQSMDYVLYTPAHCAKAKPCPAVQFVYGGPGVQSVRRSWVNHSAEMLAHRGYVVFQLDNRGSQSRGKAFEDPLHRAMAGVEVDDQLAGLAHLKSLPMVDPARVGVYGWSYGGYMTLHLVTRAPEAYAAGVAGAPVADWALYDTHYTERYMGTPQNNADGYKASSALTYLDGLARPLLVIHGMADDNVVFENSTKIIRLLQEKGKPFETMVYPGERHGIYSKGPRAHMTETWVDFLDRHLRPEPGP